MTLAQLTYLAFSLFSGISPPSAPLIFPIFKPPIVNMPDFTTALELAQIYKETGRPKKAIDVYRGILEHDGLDDQTRTTVLPLITSCYSQHKIFRQKKPLTIVFDLDETLADMRTDGIPALRPYAVELLSSLLARDDVELMVWTASTKAWADEIMDVFGQQSIIVHQLITRESPHYWHPGPDGLRVKDLEKLDRDMHRVVMIENTAHSCKLNSEHCILVEDFIKGIRRDKTFQNVYAILIELLAFVNDEEDPLPVPYALQRIVGRHRLMQHTPPLPDRWAAMSPAALNVLRIERPYLVPPYGGLFFKVQP